MKRIHIFANLHIRIRKALLPVTTLVLCIALLLIGSLQVQAATTEEVKERWYDTHYYPLYPGNEEWQKHDMFATLDILNPPHDLLLSMSTQELAALMQEHPLMSQITTYYGEDGNQDYGIFYAFMETNSDIFYELLRREDGFTCILEAYRNHEIDTELLNKTDYASVEEADRAHTMWWQEIYGCQFIRYYAPHFTESEYGKACEIIEEKKEQYATLSDTNLYYLDLPDIEPGTTKEAPAVRTNYLSEAQIQEKEERLTTAQKHMEKVENQVEEPSNAVDDAAKKDVTKLPFILATVVAIACLVGCVFVMMRKKK